MHLAAAVVVNVEPAGGLFLDDRRRRRDASEVLHVERFDPTLLVFQVEGYEFQALGRFEHKF